MMKKFILIVSLVFPILCYSQDLIVLRDGEKIDCKITKVDSSVIFYDFIKGERKISTFLSKDEIRTYQYGLSMADTIDHISKSAEMVVIDTSKYIKQKSRWVNILTFSPKFGIHATGWSVQYIGFNQTNISKWIIPLIIGVEGFEISSDYFSNFNYQAASMSYFMIGISPFLKLNDYFFINLGFNILGGDELLEDFYGDTDSHAFIGASPFQGIYFISKSNFGITVGVGVYEKILSSKIYKSDLGVKFEVGIKF
jgi:hypothetical protein